MADSDRRINHALEFLKQYWFLALFTMGPVGTVATLWFKIEYVVAAVNPETIVEYRVQESIKESKREARWCLSKLIMTQTSEPIKYLECAD